MISSTSASTTGAGASRDSATLSASFDNFLQLLTTQLEKQDPLSPMAATQSPTLGTGSGRMPARLQ